jgi:hypothetical protein
MLMPRRSEGSVGTTLGSNHRFLRLIHDHLVITEVSFDFNLDVVPGAPKAKQAELINRMKFWLDNCLENCVIMPMHRETTADFLQGINNPIMFAPSDPNDFLVQVMVHAKLNAIGAGLVNMASSHMTSDASNGFGIWFEGDPDELLPLQKDWMGEPAYYQLPWWHRGDAGMMDVPCGPEDDIKQKPDIIVDWYELMTPVAPEPGAQSAEIIRPNFKPKLVTTDD